MKVIGSISWERPREVGAKDSWEAFVFGAGGAVFVAVFLVPGALNGGSRVCLSLKPQRGTSTVPFIPQSR